MSFIIQKARSNRVLSKLVKISEKGHRPYWTIDIHKAMKFETEQSAQEAFARIKVECHIMELKPS